MFKKIRDKFSNFFISTMSGIFKIGAHIPKSIAIIMDGNRRYAQKKNLQKIKGHEEGLSTLLNVLLWCIELEIKELTVFAFSIDNFNRPREEVDSLMFLAKEKFARLAEKNEYLNQYGVKVTFYGNLNFIDEEMKNTFFKMERDTENNNTIKLNVCFPYNSSEEIYSAVNKYKKSLFEKEGEENITLGSGDKNFNLKEILESNLYGSYNCNPDIVIRTSGEIRLSNFLLYQTRFSMLFFVDKYWPEFNFRDFLNIIIRYNIDYKSHYKKIVELEKNNNFSIRDSN
jgi:ditrans,polycis-polyprenyl diphosphate synthase